MRQGVLDPVEHLDLVRMLPAGLDEHVGVRGGWMPGVRVVGGDQDQRPLGPDHLEGELDQVVVDAAVAIGVDQDQLGKHVPVAEVACHPDALLETAAPLGVDVEADACQIGDRQQHRRVADRDRWGAVAAAVGIALGLGGVDVAAAERRLARPPGAPLACQSPSQAASNTSSPAFAFTPSRPILEVLRVGALDLGGRPCGTRPWRCIGHPARTGGPLGAGEALHRRLAGAAGAAVLASRSGGRRRPPSPPERSSPSET